MTDPSRPTQSVPPTEPVLTPRPSLRLTPTERRAARTAELAGQQSTLKREAAERRAARLLNADGTN